MANPSADFTVAAGAARFSAVVAACGIVFLLLMYVGFLTPAKSLVVFGPINDFCVLVQYAFALPLVRALDGLLSPVGTAKRRAIAALGVAGCGGAVVFQALLLLGVMSFREQVWYASASILLAGLWAALASSAARRIGALTASTPLLVATVFYFGYPLWALQLSRQLRTRALQPTAG